MKHPAWNIVAVFTDLFNEILHSTCSADKLKAWLHAKLHYIPFKVHYFDQGSLGLFIGNMVTFVGHTN